MGLELAYAHLANQVRTMQEEIDHLTAQLAERDEAVRVLSEELRRLEKDERYYREQNTSLRAEVERLNGYYSPDRYHNDIEEARKQVAQECCRMVINWVRSEKRIPSQIIDDIKAKFGLEG